MFKETEERQFPPDELAEQRAKRALGTGRQAQKGREEAMLKSLSPEARDAARKVQEGKLAETELRRIHAETEALEKSVRRAMGNLSQALSIRGNVFEKAVGEARELIKQYQARPDLNEDDIEFVKSANQYVDSMEDDYRVRKDVTGAR